MEWVSGAFSLSIITQRSPITQLFYAFSKPEAGCHRVLWSLWKEDVFQNHRETIILTFQLRQGDLVPLLDL
jgi:hypothetical protein